MEHQEAIYYDSYDQNSLLHISLIFYQLQNKILKHVKTASANE